MSLFAAPREKGSGEWAAFNAIREDQAGMFRVKQPSAEPRYTVTAIRRPVRPQALFFKRGTQH